MTDDTQLNYITRPYINFRYLLFNCLFSTLVKLRLISCLQVYDVSQSNRRVRSILYLFLYVKLILIWLATLANACAF